VITIVVRHVYPVYALDVFVMRDVFVNSLFIKSLHAASRSRMTAKKI
jgi:hypothetical protein